MFLSHFRGGGYGIIGGRNNTIHSNSENCQDNPGLQLQFNRDNSSQYSFIMNNKTAGANGGGFRFQRYNGGLYLDEPLVIDQNITMNKNVSIPGGSLSCSSATIGNISQAELNCLNNCTYNIENEFNLINDEIAALQTTTGGVSTATTGITYTAGTDTTTIDNNLSISSGKNLLVGGVNVMNTLSGISYNSTSDTTLIDNNISITSGKNLLIGTNNILNRINTNSNDILVLEAATKGFSYNSNGDWTTIDNNVSINKSLLVQGMNIKAQIDALDSSFTTGTINSTDLTTNNLTVNNNSNLKTTSILTSNGLSTNSSFSVADNGGSTSRNLVIIPNCNSGAFNPNVQSGDIAITGLGSSNGVNGNLSISSWSNTKNGMRITANNTTISGGSNSLNVDSANGINITGNTTMNNDLTLNGSTNINNNVYINDALNVYNMDVNPTFTFSKTLGYSNVLVSSIVVPTNYNQRIIVNTPISVYRNGTVNNSGNIVITHFETLSSISGYYTKNDVFVGNLTISTNNTLPTTKQYNHLSNSFTYEQYFTNATCEFLPSLDKANSATYKVYFTFTYSYSVNLSSTGNTSGYYVNTTVSTTQGTTVFITGSGSNFSSTSFSYSPFDVNYMSSNNNYSQLQINNLVSNNISNQSTIKTNNILTGTTITNTLSSTNINNSSTTTTNTLASTNINNAGTLTTNIANIQSNATITNNLYVKGNIKSKSLIPGFMIDGTTNFFTYPIICSMKGFRPADTDDYYYINPGFRFVIYPNDNYSGDPYPALTNDGDTPSIQKISTVNTIGSIKVFFREFSTGPETEIIFNQISNNNPL